MDGFVGLNPLKLLTDKGISHPPPVGCFDEGSTSALQYFNQNYLGVFLVGRQS